MQLSIRTILYGAVGLTVAGIAGLLIAQSGDSAKEGKAAASESGGKAAHPQRSADRPKIVATAPVDKGRRYFKTPTTAEWQALAANLNPDKARELLERDRLEEKNVNVRAERAWLIINQLCKNGYTSEAWDLIEPSIGEVRSKGLGGFFRDADLPKQELLSLMETMPEKDRGPSLFGYWSRFTPEEFTKLDLTETPIRSWGENGAFRRTIEEIMAEVYDPNRPEDSKWLRHDVLVKAIEQANAGSFNYYEFKTILSKDVSKDGFTYWEAMKAVRPEIRATQLLGTENYDGPDAMVMRAMAEQDPEKTMSMTLVSGSHEANYIHIAMGQWLEKDFDNAKVWVDAHQASFTPDQQERTAVAFIRAQVARGEYEAASQWLGQIKNEKWINAVAWHRQQINRKLGTVPTQ